MSPRRDSRVVPPARRPAGRGGLLQLPPRLARAAAALLACLAGTLAGGCGESPQGFSGGVLAELEPLLGDVTAASCEGAPAPASGGGATVQPVTVAHSLRPAVVGCDGMSFGVDLDLPRDAVLEVAVARLDDGHGAAAVVEVRRAGQPTAALPVALPPAGEWGEAAVELGAAGPARLVLRSAGGTVAWAEPFVRPRGGRRGSGPPSLVLVSLDTVRADHLSLYGYHRATTPQLERLAASSLVFDRALSSSTWTLPSTATMLTGLLPAQHGATHRTRSLAEGVRTLAERLGAAGYRTAAVTEGGFVGPAWGLAQGFDRFDVQPGPAWQAEGKDAASTFTAAERWVRSQAGRPFFLFVHTYEAHQPYLDREGFAAPFLPPADAGARGLSRRVDPLAPPPGPQELARIVALYDGEIARADHYLGRFVAALEEATDGAVALLVTSDHGEEFLEHGDLEHGFGKVYDANVRVPLLLRLPDGRRGAAGRVPAPVSSLDVAPTLLSLAGVEHRDLPGRSLVAVASTAPASAGRARGGGAAGRPADGSADAVLVHGTPSLPLRGEERFRLEGAGPTLLVERHGGQRRVLRYDPATGALHPWPRPRRSDALLRLATLVAWGQPGGLLARLPDATRHVAVPAGSAVRPTALWSGTGWRSFEGGAAEAALRPGGPGLALSPGGPHLLAFGIEPGGGEAELRWAVALTLADDAAGEAAAGAGDAGPQAAAGDGGPAAAFRLVPRRQRGWTPFAGPLPQPGDVWRGGAVAAPVTVRLDPATAAELRALGYVD